jgi:hypothetical protein
MSWEAVYGERARRAPGAGAPPQPSSAAPPQRPGPLARDLVDEICLTLSPLVAGGAGIAMTENLAPTECPMHLARVAEQDGYLLLRYLRHPPGKNRRKF